MRILVTVFVFLILLPLGLVAQEERDSIKRLESRWSIGIYVGPNFTKPTYNLEGSMPSGDTRAGDWRYSGGIFCRYEFKSRFGLNGEISYDHLQYHYFHTNNFPSGPVIVPHVYEFDIINFPVGFNYHFGRRRIYCLGSVAVQPSLLLENKYLSGSVDPYVDQLYRNGSFCVFGKFQTEFGCGISDRMSIVLNCNYHVAFIPFIYTWTTSQNESFSRKNYLIYYKFALGLTYSL